MPEGVRTAPRGVTILGLWIALLAGCVGFDDFGTLPAVLVAFSGATLGFTHPRRAWRWGVLAVACFAVAQLLLRLLQLTREMPIGPINGDLAALAAFVGLYAGVLLQCIVVRLESDG